MPLLTVYTAITSKGLDSLQLPTVPQSPDVRMVAYLPDAKPGDRCGPWELQPPVWKRADSPRRLARRHKLLSHSLFPDSEYTLWLDGTVQLTKDALSLVPERLQGRDACFFKHSQRDCVYQEGRACIRLRKDDPIVIRAQLAGYQADGYPAHHGLCENGIILRRNTPAIAKLNETWWMEITRHSLRDQLSLNYLCWRLKIPFATFDGTVYKNDFSVFHPHNRNAPRS
jgi:hypothetical protein